MLPNMVLPTILILWQNMRKFVNIVAAANLYPPLLIDPYSFGEKNEIRLSTITGISIIES